MLATTYKSNKTAPKSKAAFFANANKRMPVKNKASKSNIPFDFANIALDTPSRIQPKLRINSPGDRYEQEADRIAEQVIRMPEGSHASPSTASEVGIQRQPLVQQINSINGANAQRKCSNCEEEEHTVQMKSNGQTPQHATSSLSSQIQNSRGRGKAMDSPTNSFMSSRFGTDFSGVRVHTDSSAARMSQGINARAFTVGQDVYFNQGQYQPNTGAGRRLLAHELVHTVQQGGVKSDFLQKADKPEGEEKKKKDKAKKEDKAEVVVKADVKGGVSTELKGKEKVAKGVKVEASATATGEKGELKASLGLAPKRSPFSLYGGLGGSSNLATQKATPFFHVKLKYKGKIADFLSIEGSTGAKFKPHHAPAYSVDGKFVFIPDHVIAPYISAGVDTGKEKVTLTAGAKIKLGKSASLNLGMLNHIDFHGKYKPGVSVGLVVPLGWLRR